MHKTLFAALVLLGAGCSHKAAEECHEACCQKPEAPAPVPLRDVRRADGVLLTGLPESTELAVCDAQGRWGVKDAVFDHSLEDPKEKAPLLPEENKPRVALYRDSLPFPEVHWKSGDWEVTQLVFPVGKGYAARYHVMNHGEEAREARLKVGLRSPTKFPGGPELATRGKPAASSLQFDFKCDPGVSQFFFVTTPDLAGAIPEDALEQATARWEKLIGNRELRLPDESASTDYYGNLAGKLLGVQGCAEEVAKVERMIARNEGRSIRLLGGIPEKWVLEAIEARELPTEFGPLTFKYQGAYNNRTFELGPGCTPPEGFLIAVPPKLVARIDGKPAAPTDGLIRVPAGAKFVEVSYPR